MMNKCWKACQLSLLFNSVTDGLIKYHFINKYSNIILYALWYETYLQLLWQYIFKYLYWHNTKRNILIHIIMIYDTSEVK